MPDREKIIKAIENCISQPKCKDCHWEDCEVEHEVVNSVPYGLLRDALALLKEQEAEWVYAEDETGIDGWYCSKCNFFEPWFYDFDNDIDALKQEGGEVGMTPQWIEADKLPSTISFFCPHCREKVYFSHGSSSKSRKHGVTKRCLYRFCPWCGEKVTPFGINYISD